MTMPLLGQMMDVPLTVSSLLAHAARHFGSAEIVSRRIEGDITPIETANSARSSLRRR
ncbi:MAG: 3-methylmercaptopropionyl-CoA ligase (EC of DmdB2 type [uncultured Paraburkholderia sp.]|nr:MAG: 3-methylmercaptopropionyl-CoA ligase (EC of DmdB2 type [uncultured Paraburkholderia sp.]CAH2908932.1 MAG: 3-methylmercaptopropionyl-CoA ligase (EC of DmdB2 type [uncultured Paraburkholderia sp.]